MMDSRDPAPRRHAGCPLCDSEGGRVLVRGAELRIVLVEDAEHPGYLRVIWNDHVAEMSDLAPAQRERLMARVWEAEGALREVFRPDKMNLASLGNQVPHLHWHVIARFVDDAHYPQPVWGARQREPDKQGLAQRRALVPSLAERIARISARFLDR